MRLFRKRDESCNHEKETKEIQETVGQYMEYATVHGVGRVKNSPFLVLKVLWLMALLTAMGLIAYQVSRLYDKWKSSPVSTSISLNSPESMTFPSVTFCNMNPAVYSQVKNNAELMGVILGASEATNLNLSTFEADLQMPELGPETYLKKFSFEEGSSDINEIANVFKMRLSSVSDDELKILSQHIDNFIPYCLYGGKLCDSSNFSDARSYDFGRCHTFPNQAADAEEIKVSAAGTDHALELVLNVNQADHLPFVSTSVGVAVTIHGMGQIPDPRKDAIILSTGTETNIAVEMVREERLQGSDARCIDDKTYPSIKQCLTDCFEDLIELQCRCTRRQWYNLAVDQTVTEGRADGREENETTAKSTCISRDDFLCIQGLQANQINKDSTCTDCKMPCSQTIYKAKTTTAAWPGVMQSTYLHQMLPSVRFNIADLVKDNLLYVRVYLSSLTYKTVSEEYSYSDENFVSDIGGQLGLWAGFSVLSICEIVELVILIVDSLWQRRRQRRSNVSHVNPAKPAINSKDGVL